MFIILHILLPHGFLVDSQSRRGHADSSLALFYFLKFLFSLWKFNTFIDNGNFPESSDLPCDLKASSVMLLKNFLIG